MCLCPVWFCLFYLASGGMLSDFYVVVGVLTLLGTRRQEHMGAPAWMDVEEPQPPVSPPVPVLWGMGTS